MSEERFIPLSVPNFCGNESKYVNDALSQGWVSTAGAYVLQLEKNIGEYLNAPERCAVVQSGTAGIHLALIDAGVSTNDMVIVPTLTFIAAVNPVKYQGAEPIFMDCDESLCMDPIKLRKFCMTECKIEEDKLIYKANGKTIKAVVVVHVFGNMADMENIMDIAKEFHLKVIEDATEALGTRYEDGKYKGSYAGTIGDYGALSFNGNKIITTGGGGAIVCKTKEAADHVRYLSTQAKDDIHNYIHGEVGYNYRMTNLQAALGVAQLELLEGFIKNKNKNYESYKEKINNLFGCRLLPFREGTRSNKWFYALYIDKDKLDLQDIIGQLADEGIQTRPIWGLINEQKPYIGSVAYQIEEAKRISRHVINIPCSTQLTEQEVEFVVEIISRLI